MYMYFLIMRPSSRKTLQNLILFSGDHIYTDITPESHPDYIRLCDECAVYLLTDTAKTLCLILSSISLYALFPLYASVMNNDLQLPCPVLLPFTDLESWMGISLNLLNQLFLNSMAVAAAIGIEGGTSIQKNAVHAFVVAIGHTINEFSRVINESGSMSAISCSHGFRQVLIQVHDFDQ